MWYISLGHIFKSCMPNEWFIAKVTFSISDCRENFIPCHKGSRMDNEKRQITARQAALLIKLCGGDISVMEDL